MIEYRAYILNLDGRVAEAVDLLSRDDDAAIAHARTLSDGYDIQVWQGRRRVDLLRGMPENNDEDASK